MNEEKKIANTKFEEIEELNCNDETQTDSKYANSYLDNNSSFNTTLNQSSFILNLEKSKIDFKNEGTKKKKKNKMPILIEEFKEQIENIIDQQFEDEYEKLNRESEEKIEQLLNEQEKINIKNEILKAKYNALEKYLKNDCKKANIDYESLLSV